LSNVFDVDDAVLTVVKAEHINSGHCFGSVDKALKFPMRITACPKFSS
jgi:hypothetical protein